MDRSETKMLFNLLKTYFPNAKKATDRNTQRAWEWVLEPYSYEDAKAAVIACVREKNFFPDVTDITSRCTPRFPVSEPPGPKAGSQYDLLWERWKEFCGKLDAAGIPHLADAVVCGQGYDVWEKSCVEWEQRVVAAGIDLDWIGAAAKRPERVW